MTGALLNNAAVPGVVNKRKTFSSDWKLTTPAVLVVAIVNL